MLHFKKYRLFCLLFTAMLFAGGCERLEDVNIEGFDCARCYQDKPEYVQLRVKVTINEENPYVALTVYVGDFEENVIDWEDVTYNGTYWVDVYPDRYYSVKAEYKEGSKTVYAIDGDKVKLQYNSSDCDLPCYYQVGGYIDVSLE